MKKFLSNTILATLLVAPAAYAQDTVGKVIQIKAVDSGKDKALTYQHKGDSKWFAGYVDLPGKLNDKFQTDANTVASLEFLLGGRVGINKNSIIEITSETSVSDKKTKVKRINLKQGGMWAKTVNLKEPLEIQTNGGVMGIKGTEFAIDTQPGGDTTVAVLEGAVEVHDNTGKVVGQAKPGDKYTIPFKGVPTVKTYESQSQLRDELKQSTYRDIDQAFNWATTALSWTGINTGAFGYYSYYGRGLVQLVQDPEGAAKQYAADQLNSALSRYVPTGPFGISIPRPTYNLEDHRNEIVYPSKLSPDSGPNSAGDKTAKDPIKFTWAKINGADGYVVLVSKAESFDEIAWSARVKDGEVTYPTEARKLDKGRYYWRVIPVTDEDKLADGKKAAQAYFDVP